MSEAITIMREDHPEHGKVWRLEAEQVLDHTVEDVFPFFSDAYNLERLTPSFLRFHVVSPARGEVEMGEGLIIRYKLRVRGLPIRWKTEILDWDPPRRFVDNQASGPYALWHHTHTFEPIDGGARTLCRDVVLYRPLGGPLAPLINALAVRRDVEQIFRYRFRRLEEIFPVRRSDSGEDRDPTEVDRAGIPSISG